MSYEHIRLEFEEERRLALLTVNRPEVRNALDGTTITELYRALDEVERARTAALILTGAGDRAFVAGADVRALRQRRRDDALAAINSRVFSAIERHPAVSIAAVNGYALGGGCELALACDVRVAAEGAVFGLPEPRLGIIPGAGGTQRLPRIVGLGRAKEMILTGARWDARRALEVGLVSAIAPREGLLDAAREIAGRVLELGPLAVRLAKRALNASSEMGLAAGLAFETATQAITFESADKLEGMSAFLDKRPPRFTGK